MINEGAWVLLTSVNLFKWDEISHLPDTGLSLIRNFAPPLWSSAFYIQNSDATILSRYFTTVLISWLISFQRLFLSPLNQVSSTVPFLSVTGDIYPHGMQCARGREQCLQTYDNNAEATQTSHTPTESEGCSFIRPLTLLRCFMFTQCLHLCVGQFVC